MYLEFLFRRAHSRRRVDRKYWSGVSLYSFTTCSNSVTVGTIGPIGSGLPQFGFPRLLAMNLPWLGVLLLNTLDSRDLQKDSKILYRCTENKTEENCRTRGMKVAGRSILREVDTKSMTRPFPGNNSMKNWNLPAALCLFGKMQ